MNAWTGVLDLAVPGTAPGAPPDSSLEWVTTADGRWRLSFSGFLANRRDLIRQYGMRPDAADADLALVALSSHGSAGLARLVGDFVLAAWQASERQLFLARDSIGFRPLFYCDDGTRLWWSTDLEQLAGRRGPLRGAPVNEGYIAEFLVDAITSIDETPIQGVRRLLPATLLRVGPDGTRTLSPYWSPPTTLPARRRDDDLCEEFRALLGEAVASQTAESGAVAAHLSGGLDSTSVFATAARDAARPPRAYSIVFPGIALSSDGEVVDESGFIDTALAQIPSSGSWRLDALRTERSDFLRVLTAHGDLPEAPNADPLTYPLARRAAADGCGVMLTGLGGDMWLTGTIARAAQLVQRGRLIAAARFVRDATAPRSIETSVQSVVTRMAGMLLPPFVKASVRAPLRWTRRRSWPAWLSDDLIRRTSLADRLATTRQRVPPVDDLVLRDSLARFYLPEVLLGREASWRTGRDAGIDVRHPFYDARLVAFLMTLPDDLRFRHGDSRYIVRRALADRLPDAIARRRSKGDATLLFGVAVNRVLGGAPPRSREAVRRGWIVEDVAWRDAVASCLAEPLHVHAAGGYVWQTLAADAWAEARG